MTRNNTLAAVGLLMAATLSWGGMFPVAKPALALIDPYYLTAIRYGSAAVIFAVLLAALEGRRALSFDGRAGTAFLLGTLGFAGFNLLAFAGLEHTRPEHGAVIVAMMPMITVLLTWFFKGVRPPAFTLVSVALAFSGVFLVITGGDPARALEGGAAHADLLVLAGAFCWVGYTMGAERFPKWSPLRYTTLTCIPGAISIFAIAAAMTMAGPLHVPSAATLVSIRWVIAYLVVLGALVAVLSWNAGIRRLGPVNGVLFINLVPVTAFTIGVAAGHAFRATELAGAGLVIASLVANNLYLRWQNTRRAPTPALVTGNC